MKITEFKKAVKYQHNEVKKVGFINIAKVDWKNKPWLIIEDNETFEEAKKDNFNPIIDFYTLNDLIKYSKNIILEM